MAKLPEKSRAAARKTGRSTRASAAETDAVTPRLGGRVARKTPPPHLDASPAFLLCHHPESWIVMNGNVIPRFAKVKLQPGVNGVIEGKDGEINAMAAIDDARNNGLTVIPWDVDGEGTSYLRVPKGAPHAHITRFERVYAGSQQVDCDEDVYVAWCNSLIERDIIPAAPEYILHRLAAGLRKEIGSLEDVRGQGAYRKLLERNLAGVLDALEAFEPEDAETEVPELNAKLGELGA